VFNATLRVQGVAHSAEGLVIVLNRTHGGM